MKKWLTVIAYEDGRRYPQKRYLRMKNALAWRDSFNAYAETEVDLNELDFWAEVHRV